jgi:MFS family permease
VASDDESQRIVSTNEGTSGVFLTVPYGYMADKYGRKPVRILALLGLLFSILWAFIVCKRPNLLLLYPC